MDFPELHRRFSFHPIRETKPPSRPGGLPRQGDLCFRTLSAWLMANGKLSPTTIFEKPDQNFSAYATNFETQWSRAANRNNALNPIVDADLTVVGHAGRISAASILVPKNIPYNKDKDLLPRLLSAGIAFFVASGPPNDAWELYLPVKSGEGAALNVVAGIDGRVMAVSDLRPTGAGAVAEAFSPVDAFLIVKGVVSLGAAAVRFMVRGLAAKSAGSGAVALFSGPTGELAQLAARASAAQALPRTTQYVAASGLPAKHFSAFQQAAQEAKVIAVVRTTNPASLKLIEAGCPGKPVFFKFHTSPSTGVVMAESQQDIAQAWAREYFVVGADGVARREVLRQGKRITETLDLRNPFWKLEKGQVLDPALKKPLVGDYDLMGVINPSSPGSNISLVATSERGILEDVSSPLVRKFSENVNAKLDMPRVLHGAQDQYGGFRGAATAFHPDGTVTHLPSQDAVKKFYDALARQTAKGKYAQPPGVPPPPDELAARRALRAGRR